MSNSFSEQSSVTRVPCPSCQADVEVELTYAITPHSEEFQYLFEGRLNQGTCSACGVKFVLTAPLVFKDDEGGYLVYQMPLDDHSEWKKIEEQVEKMAADIFSELPQKSQPECRVTFHRRNFIEKIAAYSAGLDDRLLEYIKYQLYSREEERVDPVRYELLLDFSQGDEEKLVFILFDRETGEASAAAHIPMETYHELDDAFQHDEALDEELDRLFPGPYVSVERLYD